MHRGLSFLDEPHAAHVGREVVDLAGPFEGLVARVGQAAADRQCCRPVPGDPIVGYISLGKGITIHDEVCPNARALNENPRSFAEIGVNILEARCTVATRSSRTASS